MSDWAILLFYIYLNARAHQITAVFGASSNFNGSTSDILDQEMNRAASSITATGSTTFTYNGAAQGPASSSVTGSTGAVTTAIVVPPTVAFLTGLPLLHDFPAV